MPEERREVGFNDQFPDSLRGRPDIVLGMLQQVIEEFSTGDLVGRGRPHLPSGLFPQQLIS